MPAFRGYLIPRNKLPFWDKLVIDGNFLTYKRFKIIGIEEKRIHIKHINSVNLKRGILFCSIIISAMGDTIIAEGFTNTDGKEIRRLLGF